MGDRRLFRPARGRSVVPSSGPDELEVTPDETPSADIPDEPCARTPLTVEGVIARVSLGSRGDAPALEAEIDATGADGDGTEGLVLVWLGRTEIAGIHPGREIVATARICAENGARVMYNPRYDLR